LAADTVLLTGITGFIGSHLAETLSEQYQVVGLVRKSSDLWRCDEIKNPNIILVDLDGEGALNHLQELSPRFLIHSAWGGVSAANRDDWQAQVENVLFAARLLRLARELGIKHFISFGSQAEYRSFSGRVDENQPRQPISAYGASKLATCNIMEAFCTRYDITWNWFRLFSVYGTRESWNWFIPSLIKNALKNTDMDLTGCEQRYDYIYGPELGEAILKVMTHEPVSGVFNLTSNGSVSLKSIVEKIRDKTGTKAQFKFGALPYRENQVMHMEGNSEKFSNTFNFAATSNFDTNLAVLIEYYKRKIESVNV
jgi:nucleoside-diphosphate-sugar epimerase